MAQYAGNPTAAIYGSCANGLVFLGIAFIVIVGILIIADIL